jgi:hypothetical protein
MSEGPSASAAEGSPVETVGLERELELDEERVLYVADNISLEDEAGATTWDCGLVLAHYLIKQHEMGEVRMDTAHKSSLRTGPQHCSTV